MHRPSSPPRRLLCALFLAILLPTAQGSDAYRWSVQYLIDNSRSVFGRPQKVWPRHNRGLAASPDGRFLYAGYHHGFSGGEVRQLAMDGNDLDRVTLAVLPGPLAKAIATDDRGRVYIADEAAILIYDADLRHQLHRIPTEACEGLATVRDGGSLLLFATERAQGTVLRWTVQEDNLNVAGVAPSGFDGSGILKIPDAKDLRGIEADGKGNLWVADCKGNNVFRIRRDGSQLATLPVTSPLDIGVDGDRIFVTRYTERAITVMNSEMAVLGSLGVPWEELELSPVGNNQAGALSGIAVLPGRGFFVTNEGGQTANQRSTYGRADEHSDMVGAKLFKDSFGDDNEPILRATVVAAQP